MGYVVVPRERGGGGGGVCRFIVYTVHLYSLAMYLHKEKMAFLYCKLRSNPISYDNFEKILLLYKHIEILTFLTRKYKKLIKIIIFFHVIHILEKKTGFFVTLNPKLALQERRFVRKCGLHE